jgi:hypothetical protein
MIGNATRRTVKAWAGVLLAGALAAALLVAWEAAPPGPRRPEAWTWS